VGKLYVAIVWNENILSSVREITHMKIAQKRTILELILESANGILISFSTKAVIWVLPDEQLR
jgi:predicted NAD-dependent protein-ADP-ribosyltransferase YbiA (DUF1768 family)